MTFDKAVRFLRASDTDHCAPAQYYRPHLHNRISIDLYIKVVNYAYKGAARLKPAKAEECKAHMATREDPCSNPSPGGP
uniref:Uncharacterized protein n=1 Tax=Magnetospirillum gryphiswaldense TaxID=55518 RepID=A4U040_9PROT|nr:hypothetical protein MGR_2192 [Magnetospirillum gryphiswaldense MSR-1]